MNKGLKAYIISFVMFSLGFAGAIQYIEMLSIVGFFFFLLGAFMTAMSILRIMRDFKMENDIEDSSIQP